MQAIVNYTVIMFALSLNTDHAVRSERILLTTLLYSAPGPFIVLLAAISSRSAMQMADCIRRSAEVVASFVAWLVFHKLKSKNVQTEEYRLHLERLANLAVALAIIFSGLALCLVGITRLFANVENKKPIAGLIIAGLGLIINIFFWYRYRKLSLEQNNAVLTAQEKLYRAKTSVDLCVTIALTAVVVASTHPATRYIDAFGSIGVAVYLLVNGISGLYKTNKSAVILH